MFVHQSKFQRHLMKRYGPAFVIMDSTYNITRYDMPLFLLIVVANVGYFGLGTFIIERERTEEIVQALRIIQSWN